jgi:hypothetical protein
MLNFRYTISYVFQYVWLIKGSETASAGETIMAGGKTPQPVKCQLLRADHLPTPPRRLDGSAIYGDTFTGT